MTTLVDAQGYQRTFRDIRNVRRLFGYSTTTAEDANCKFWDLPIASKKSVLQDSVYLIGKLLTHRYHEITTHLTNEEKVALYILASRLKSPCVAVEIGSFLGCSACFIALGLGRSGRLYCVDTWKNDAMDDPTVTLRDTFSDFMENVRDFQRVIVPLRGNSVEVAKSFENRIASSEKIIDFLFIDGDHSFEGCLGDWLSWCKYLAPSAVVAFHDISWADGVNKVINDYVSPRIRREVRMANLYVAWL